MTSQITIKKHGSEWDIYRDINPGPIKGGKTQLHDTYGQISPELVVDDSRQQIQEEVKTWKKQNKPKQPGILYNVALIWEKGK